MSRRSRLLANRDFVVGLPDIYEARIFDQAFKVEMEIYRLLLQRYRPLRWWLPRWRG